MESAFAAADSQSPTSLPPPDLPPLDLGWTAAGDGATDGVAAQAPLDWSQHPHQQQVEQAVQQQAALPPPGAYWGPPMDPAGSLPIPAHWGADGACFSGTGSGELGGAPPFAATWPLPDQGHPMMPVPMQPPPHYNPQQAAELYAAAVPWYSSWPAPEQQTCQAYMLGAAADGMAMPPPCVPPPCFPGGPYPMQQPYPVQQLQGPFPGSFALQQQPCALPPPAFAISPPAPAQAARQGRLVARKKKAALPAEPSFGCDSGNLEGGSSAVLLLSAEASQAPDELAAAGAGEQALGTPRSRAPSLAAASAAAAATAEASSGPAAQPAQPSIEFDKAPRTVEWRPYSLAEYRQKHFDAKQAAAKYWALGSLGPTQPSSEQAGKRERQQQFGQAVSKANRERIAAQAPRPGAPPTRPGADVRQRALQFAKHSVPKPSSFKSRSAGSSLGRCASGTAAAAAAAAEAVAQADAAAEALPAGLAIDQGSSAAPAAEDEALALLREELGGMALAGEPQGAVDPHQETAAAGGQP
ncbi:hypothetical protein ABPG75_012766 [Micractinium tetrahymenae]